MYAFLYICMRVCKRKKAETGSQQDTLWPTCFCLFVCFNVNVLVCTFVHTYVSIHTYAYVYACEYVRMTFCACVCVSALLNQSHVARALSLARVRYLRLSVHEETQTDLTCVVSSAAANTLSATALMAFCAACMYALLHANKKQRRSMHGGVGTWGWG